MPPTASRWTGWRGTCGPNADLDSLPGPPVKVRMVKIAALPASPLSWGPYVGGRRDEEPLSQEGFRSWPFGAALCFRPLVLGERPQVDIVGSSRREIGEHRLQRGAPLSPTKRSGETGDLPSRCLGWDSPSYRLPALGLWLKHLLLSVIPTCRKSRKEESPSPHPNRSFHFPEISPL